MEATASHRRCLERELRTALERDEFELFYQPRIDLQEDRQHRARSADTLASARTSSPLPAFLGIAELVGLGQEARHLGDPAGCAQAASWRKSAFAPQGRGQCLGQQSIQPELPALLQEILEQTALATDRLELDHRTGHHRRRERSQDRQPACAWPGGVQLAIDDFGSGFSSFAYLRHLPVHTIKIDSSFIGRIGQNRNDEIIIRSMIELGHALGKRVVAEGVETRQQLEFLRERMR